MNKPIPAEVPTTYAIVREDLRDARRPVLRWTDPDTGLPPSSAALTMVRTLVDVFEPAALQPPHLYLDDGGGVKLEWSNGEHAISLTVPPGAAHLELHDTNTTTVAHEACTLPATRTGALEAQIWLAPRLGSF